MRKVCVSFLLGGVLALPCSAEIVYRQIGWAKCPDGAKVAYSADFEVYDEDGSAGPVLLGWHYVYCDGSERFVSNQTRTPQENSKESGTDSSPLLSERVRTNFRSIAPSAIRLARSRGVMAEIRIMSDSEYEATQSRPSQARPLNVK